MSQDFTLAKRERRESRLTGRHVLIALIAFFAVIFAANGLFLYLAVSSFPGLEVASAYKAGQEYEAEIAAAAAQDDRGWKVDSSVALNPRGAEVEVGFTDKNGAPLKGLEVMASLEHPAQSALDRSGLLHESRPGVYSAVLADVGEGRRTLVLTARAQGKRQFLSRNQVTLAR